MKQPPTYTVLPHRLEVLAWPKIKQDELQRQIDVSLPPKRPPTRPKPNTAQYAINGYSVGATNYMLKPVPYFCFSQQLKKAVGQLQKRARFDLTVTAEDGMRRLNTAEIYYIESDGHTVHFYTENGDFSASGLLKNFEEKLAGRPFARCNNCYLVNLAQVAGIAQEIVKIGPHSLPVSRTKRRAFLDAMSDYIDSASAV